MSLSRIKNFLQRSIDISVIYVTIRVKFTEKHVAGFIMLRMSTFTNTKKIKTEKCNILILVLNLPIYLNSCIIMQGEMGAQGYCN